MENLLVYLLRASIALAAFYLAYLLLFQKRKHFRFNRIYLTGSMLISYCIPLITFEVKAPPVAARLSVPVQQVQASPDAAVRFFWELFSWEQIAAAIFLFGSFLFLIRLTAGHLRAQTLIKQARRERVNGISCLVSDQDIHPFTYFNRIVIPSDSLKTSYLNLILQHEQIHVKEQHTIDVCIAEFLFLFQWFNPFAWLMRDAVRNNLEFLADDHVIRHADPQNYQLAMVTLVGKSGVPPFLTALDGSQLKNRIIMMKTKHKGSGLIRKFLLLPIITGLIITLSNREFRAEASSPDTRTVSGKVVSKETGEGLVNAAILVKGTQIGTLTDREGNYVLKLEDQDATLVYQFPGYQAEEVTVGAESRIDVQLNKAPGTTHIEVVGYATQPKVVYKDSVKVKVDLSDSVQVKKGFRVLVDDTVKTKVQIRVVPKDSVRAKKDVRVMVYDTIKTNINISNLTKDSVKVKVGVREPSVTIRYVGKDTINPLFVIDGVKMGKGMTSTLMPPEDIESISVLKNESSTSLYGEEGKKGVIIITTKKKK